GAAVKRDRGDGAAQPYAHRAAAAVLHAFLGERRRAQACAGVACRARQDRERQELTCWSTSDQSSGAMPACWVTRVQNSSSDLRNAPTFSGGSGLLSYPN